MYDTIALSTVILQEGVMPRQYEKKMKNEVAHLICVERKSTIKTAEEYKVPLKTVEKWVTAFNKNNKVFEENAD